METRGATGPILRRGTVRGRWPGEGKAWPVGPGYSVSPAQLRITTRVLLCCSKSGYPCCRVPTECMDNFHISTTLFHQQSMMSGGIIAFLPVMAQTYVSHQRLMHGHFFDMIQAINS